MGGPEACSCLRNGNRDGVCARCAEYVQRCGCRPSPPPAFLGTASLPQRPACRDSAKPQRILETTPQKGPRFPHFTDGKPRPRGQASCPRASCHVCGSGLCTWKSRAPAFAPRSRALSSFPSSPGLTHTKDSRTHAPAHNHCGAKPGLEVSRVRAWTPEPGPGADT